MVIDLSELLDLHEQGFSVRTGEQLEVSRALTLSLELPETKSYIHGTGQVVWSDQTGRSGIRFSYIPEPSRKVLKQWLFANLLVACSNHAARVEQRSQQIEIPDGLEAVVEQFPIASGAERLPVAEPPMPVVSEPVPSKPAAPPRSSLATIALSTPGARASVLSALDDVRGEVRELAGGSEAIFDLLVLRAIAFTGAGGAALALLTEDAMVCRASSGSPAPPLGSTVDIEGGLSGECVRTGLTVLCEDIEIDPRVDTNLCRSLGIHSFMAVPIFADFRVVGLLEVFSPYPGTFSKFHETILDRLAELVPKPALARVSHDAAAPAVTTQPSWQPGEVPTPGQQTAAAPASTPVERPHEGGIETPTHSADVGVPGVAVIHAVQAIAVPEERVADRHSDSDAAAGSEASSPAVIETASVARSRHIQEPPATDAQVSNRTMPVIAEPRTDSEPGLDEQSAGAGTARARSAYAHFGLLFSVVGVVALVVGYLLAPVIEKRWGNPESSQTAAPSTVVSPASQVSSAARKPTPLSLDDLRRLADQGDPEAQWHLGTLYHDGEGVPQDDTQAVQWFLRSAEQGYVLSQATLGAYYWAGRGVPKDYSKAYFWSALALARGGDENSKSRLEGLSAQMTQSQVVAARQAAERWLQAHDQSAARTAKP
jgi:hypothetical protein